MTTLKILQKVTLIFITIYVNQHMWFNKLVFGLGEFIDFPLKIIMIFPSFSSFYVRHIVIITICYNAIEVKSKNIIQI